MQPQISMNAFTPDEIEPARRVWQAAAEDLAAELESGIRNGIAAEWSEETADFVKAGLALFVSACFDALEGNRDQWRLAEDLAKGHGATRAHRQVALITHLRTDIETRTQILDRLAEAAARSVPLELNWRVLRALAPLFDDLLVAHMLAYGEEAAALRAEQEDTVAFTMRVSKAAFAHGGLHGVVTYCNDRFADYFSRSGGSGPAGITWDELLPAETRGLLTDARAGVDGWADIEITDGFGATRLVRLFLHPAQDRLQAVAIDVGERAAYERRHSEFVRGLIHDLRAPLTLISGWSRTLIDSADRLDERTRHKALDTINRAALQLGTLTENLLELEVIQTGTHRFSSEPVDVAALARSFGDVIGPELDVDAPDPVFAATDADAVMRILTNLVDNAVTHGAPPVSIHVHAVPEAVTIDLVDGGAVDEELVTVAFRSRVDSTKGFGIGLRTAWLMADALGGNLTLTSTQPTTFTLTLPAA